MRGLPNPSWWEEEPEDEPEQEDGRDPEDPEVDLW